MTKSKSKFVSILPVIFLFLLLTACSSATSGNDSKDTIESLANNDTDTKETESKEKTEEELLEYEYEPERTFYTKVYELGELMPDDANAETYEAMETVISNEYRKILQEKYNQGFYFSLEGRFDEVTENSEPALTGNITMYLPDDTETQTLEVGTENFDFAAAREKYEQENERQIAQLQKELEEEIARQEQSTNINSYEDAVQILKEELGDTDDAIYPHIFTDLGFVEDTRSYYYINVRQQGEEKSMAIGRVRVYIDNAEIVWE